jgi:hypothetical protein
MGVFGAHVDLAARADAVADDGGAHDLPVEDDGEVVPDVRAAEALELSTPGPGQLELHLRRVELRIASGRCVLELGTGQEGLGLQHVEALIGAGAASHDVRAPLERLVARKRPVDLGQ